MTALYVSTFFKPTKNLVRSRKTVFISKNFEKIILLKICDMQISGKSASVYILYSKVSAQVCLPITTTLPDSFCSHPSFRDLCVSRAHPVERQTSWNRSPLLVFAFLSEVNHMKEDGVELWHPHNSSPSFGCMQELRNSGSFDAPTSRWPLGKTKFETESEFAHDWGSSCLKLRVNTCPLRRTSKETFARSARHTTQTHRKPPESWCVGCVRCRGNVERADTRC